MVQPAFLAPPEVDVLGGPTQALAHSVCEREGGTNGRTDGWTDRQTGRPRERVDLKSVRLIW
jgi:hypothetical protein